MNKPKLKSYAPAARRDLIKAVTERAHYFGVDADKIVSACFNLVELMRIELTTYALRTRRSPS
jgi:hypothetical protein